jgi:acyl-coenzyme A thioesterase PaaI-like protein
MRVSSAAGGLMARGYHVKYVVPPLAWKPFLALRPSLAERLLLWAERTYAGRVLHIGGRVLDLTSKAAEKGHGAAPPPPAKHQPRSEVEYRAYLSRFGEADDAGGSADTGRGAGGAQQVARTMMGFDGPLHGALSRAASTAQPEEERSVCWSLLIGKAHANTFESIHGGCSASLVASLGCAALAAAHPSGSGRVTSLDVQFAATARVGSRLSCVARPLGRGTSGRGGKHDMDTGTFTAAAAEVRLSDAREKLVAMGTVSVAAGHMMT